MAIIFFYLCDAKNRLGGLEKGHSFKKLRDDRGLELAES